MVINGVRVLEAGRTPPPIFSGNTPPRGGLYSILTGRGEGKDEGHIGRMRPYLNRALYFNVAEILCSNFQPYCIGKVVATTKGNKVMKIFLKDI